MPFIALGYLGWGCLVGGFVVGRVVAEQRQAQARALRLANEVDEFANPSASPYRTGMHAQTGPDDGTGPDRRGQFERHAA